MPNEPKNILVTGGAGFIGSFLCEELLREGHHVICIDNFSTGYVRNIDPYLRDPNFQFLRLDINQPFDLASFAELEPFNVKFTGIQEIYHLAVPTSIKQFDKFRIQTLLTNSVGTAMILETAAKYKAKMVLGSTSVVYGSRTESQKVFVESDFGLLNHLTPRACYDEGKKFAETMMFTYEHVYGIDAKIARIFRTYGPRMPLFDGHQIPDFILHALNGEPLVINGTEDFQTSMIYVADVVDGLIRLMAAPKGIGPVNIGSDVDLKLKDVADMVIKMCESTSTIEYKDALEFLTELGIPDIKKAKEQLGWLPLVRLEDGLQKTIDYIRANKILLTEGDL
ncbi:MAG: GDP-mannose 4,6-dehydratase [Patescibacteria group bacterium]|jgi:UDP-glucuronate decarboxylase